MDRRFQGVVWLWLVLPLYIHMCVCIYGFASTRMELKNVLEMMAHRTDPKSADTNPNSWLENVHLYE